MFTSPNLLNITSVPKSGNKNEKDATCVASFSGYIK